MTFVCGESGGSSGGTSSMMIFHSPGRPPPASAAWKLVGDLTGGNVAEINFDFRAGSRQSQCQPETEEKFLHSTQRNKKDFDDKESVGHVFKIKCPEKKPA